MRTTRKEGPPDRSGSTTKVLPRINPTARPRRTAQEPPMPLPSKVEEKSPNIPKETTVLGGGITDTPALRPPPPVGRAFIYLLILRLKTNLLTDNDPRVSSSRATTEERREHRAPLQETKEEKDRKELGVGLTFSLLTKSLIS